MPRISSFFLASARTFISWVFNFAFIFTSKSERKYVEKRAIERFVVITEIFANGKRKAERKEEAGAIIIHLDK